MSVDEIAEVVQGFARAHQGSGIWQALEETPSVHDAIERFLLATAEAYSAVGDPSGCLIVLGTQHGLDATNAAHRELQVSALRASQLRHTDMIIASTIEISPPEAAIAALSAKIAGA
jgi:hypothetical protein